MYAIRSYYGNNLYYVAFRNGKFYKANGDYIKDLEKDGPRITSYNVCYTKLLRMRRVSSHLHYNVIVFSFLRVLIRILEIFQIKYIQVDLNSTLLEKCPRKLIHQLPPVCSLWKIAGMQFDSYNFV